MERTHILVGIAVAGAGVTAAWRVCGGLATAVEVSAVKPVTIGAKEAAARRPVLMLFGDSITQFSFNPELCGWGAALAHWYARQADVLNRGFSGYNTRQGRILLQKLLPLPETGVSTQPRLLTIMFGANDAADAVHNARQHVPVSEYESNLRDMIAHARAACPGILIVLITPPPLDEKAYAAHNLALKRRKASDPIDRSIGRVRPYVEAVARVADSLGCPMVNLWDGAPRQLFGDDSFFVRAVQCVTLLRLQGLIRSDLTRTISATGCTWALAGTERCSNGFRPECANIYRAMA